MSDEQNLRLARINMFMTRGLSCLPRCTPCWDYHDARQLNTVQS